MEAGGATIGLLTEFFSSLLSFEGAFSNIVSQEYFSRGKPPDLSFAWYNYEKNILNNPLLEKILKTKI